MLNQIGVFPDKVLPSQIDETPLVDEMPRELVVRLARNKTNSIAASHPEHTILGADTIVVCGRRLLPKAENSNEADTFLRCLSGRSHKVITCIVIVSPTHKSLQRLVETSVKFKRLSSAEINQYLETEEWRDKAGAYGIQGLAAQFVRSINGSYSNVVGLPLFETSQLLKGIGYNL